MVKHTKSRKGSGQGKNGKPVGVNVPRVAKCPGQTDKAKATHVGDLHLTSWENWHAPHGLVFKQPKVTAAQTPENGNGPEGLYLIQPDDLGLEEQGGAGRGYLLPARGRGLGGEKGGDEA